MSVVISEQSFDIWIHGGRPQTIKLDLNHDHIPDLFTYAHSGLVFNSVEEPAYAPLFATYEIEINTGRIIQNSDPTIGPEQLLLGSFADLADINADNGFDIVFGEAGWDPYDSDEKPIVGIATGGSDLVLLAQTNGTWLEDRPSDRTFFTHGSAIADFNLDGADDVFFASIDDGAIQPGNLRDPAKSYILLGDHENQFEATQEVLPYFLTASEKWLPDGNTYTNENGQLISYQDIFTASVGFDVNGDHAPDLVLLPTTNNSNGIILINDGTGDFRASTPIDIPAGYYGSGGYVEFPSVRSGSQSHHAEGLDYDLDGDFDLAVLSTYTSIDGDERFDYYQGAVFDFYRNTGGQFILDKSVELMPRTAGNLSHAEWFEPYDINRDGYTDVVAYFPAGSNPDEFKTRVVMNNQGVFSSEVLTVSENWATPMHIDGVLHWVNFDRVTDGYDDAVNHWIYRRTISVSRDDLVNSQNRIGGHTGAEEVFGSPMNDVFIWSGGGDHYLGFDGVDSLRIDLDAREYQFDLSAESIGFDFANEYSRLSSVERIEFLDKSYALDLDGSAGFTAKTLAAVIGEDGLSNKEYVGIGLQLFDAGQSLAAVCELALGAVGATTNEDVVNLLYTNLYGEAPTADVAQPFIDALTNGEYSKGVLASAAAELTDDLGVIDLVGLAETGIEYV